MPDRPDVPAELERRLMIEAGHRCAIPLCRATQPLELAHIVPFAQVRRHEFENMIVLCANCHGREGNRRGQIDRRSLLQYKANLAVINSRYSDLERRALEFFAERRTELAPIFEGNPRYDQRYWPRGITLQLHGSMRIMMNYLINDGYVEIVEGGTTVINAATGEPFMVDAASPGLTADREYYRLTKAGVDFLDAWLGAQPIDDIPASEPGA